MTQWNSSYYRNKSFNRAIKGSVDSIVNGIQFLTVETEISSVFFESIKKYSKSSTDISKFIALSPSLTFNILNLAQSPFCNTDKNISGFNDAFRIIGNNIIVHLIKDFLAGSAGFREMSSVKPCINSHYYGSLKSAHLSALIAEELKFSSQFTAYVAALLHNIGANALSVKFPIQYNRLKTSTELSNLELPAEEDHVLGVNHCFLGARMVEHWPSFPFLADAIYYHHHTLTKIKQASQLVKLTHFSSMVDNCGKSDHSQIIETGMELFDFTESQIDEYISIAELKVQNRLLHLGIEVSDDTGEVIYQPDYQRERIRSNEAGDNSLLSLLINNVRSSENEKSTLSQIGKSLHLLTGLNEIFYFKYNKDNNSLNGISLRNPENTELLNDFSIPIDAKSSIIVASFLMGMDINSLDRVNNTEPALFDLQMLNFMGTDGLYCLPLIDSDEATGVIVLGINTAGTALEDDTVKKLRYFTESITPFLSKSKIKDSYESASINKNIKSDSLQTRKLIHEINNPLSAIKNYLKVLNMKLDDINVENSEIRIIDDELNRIAKLLKEFKSSSGGKVASKTTSSINSIVSDTILLINNSRLNGPQINIEFEIDENMPDIMVDKDAFRQVLINLINNSIEAMPMGGNISVEVSYKKGMQQVDAQTADTNDDEEKIEISITDDGPGIPKELIANLFKKQSTTKDDHDGLGLLIVHDLVKKMGGSITLDDQYNEGACFKITLPAV